MPSLVTSAIVIPASNGRVLRFRGDMLHSVPRPTSRYLETGEFGTGADNENDDEEEEESYTERAVLLFNTWDVPPEAEHRTGSIKTDDDNWFTPLDNTGIPAKPVPPQAPKSAVLPFTPPWCCRPRSKWIERRPHAVVGGSGSPAEQPGCVLGVPLLGGRFRRGREANALVLVTEASAAHVSAAMARTSQPSTFPVHEVLCP